MSTPSPPSSPPSDANPNLTASTPPPTTVVALAAASDPASASASANKKPQPVLWAHEETLHLIEAYKEKWYSMNRGQLKAAHWEEIAVTVSARSGFDRSATQCRHKIEKMRKRFRSERQRMGPNSIWPYYGLMDELDRNPTPISARPITRLPPKLNYREDDDEDADEDDGDDNRDDDNDEDDDDGRNSKSRSINYILRRPSTVNRFAGNAAAGNYGVEEAGHSGFAPQMRKRRLGDEDEREARERRLGLGLGLAAEIRRFAERMMLMEKRKMEMMRETERRRMEMESKRIQMIKSSQKKVADLIAGAFGSENLKLEQEA